MPQTALRRWASSALAVTVLSAGLVTLTSAGPAAAAPPDPLVQGPAAVTRVLYDEGPTLVGGGTSQTVLPQQIEGALFLPDGPGPFPVVLFMHGRHATCDLTVTEFLGDPCPETPVTSPVQSFTGYDDTASLLASHGYLVASVDANGVNSYDLTAGDAGAHARSQVIAKTLDLVSSWSAGDTPSPGGVDLRGKADLSRIGLMGHSRGGEGVTDFLAYNRVRPASPDPANGPDSGPRYPGLRAVFALAPIDRKAQVPVGAAHASLVPYCDGDVRDLSGTRPYERAVTANSAAGFPSVQYGVQGANHNDFNTVWTNDDNGGSTDIACGRDQDGGTRLQQPDAYKLGSTLITSFLRRYVGPEPALDDLVTGRAPLPASACASGPSVPCDEQVQTSYAAPADQRHVVLAPAGTASATPTVTDAGGRLAAEGFTQLTACTPTDAGTGCPDPDAATPAFVNRSTTRQLTAVWDGPASLELELAGSTSRVAPGAALLVRAGASHTDVERNPAGVTQDFTMTLTDASGRSATVPASAYARGTLVPQRGTAGSSNRELVLGDVRVPVAAFGGVDPSRLTTLRLGFGGLTPRGSLQLAQVAFSDAVTPPAPVASPPGRSSAPVPVAAPDPSATAAPSATPSAGPAGSPSPRAGAAGRFHAVTPARLLDTRGDAGPTAAGDDRLLRVTGAGGVPSTGVSSVLLNVTVTGGTTAGDLQLYPVGARPARRTSNLNWRAGQTVPVAVALGVGSRGRVGLSVSHGAAHLVVDVLGWYGDDADTTGSSYGSASPQRVLDTRRAGGAVVAGADRTVRLAGVAGVPADATAVVLNATALGADGATDLQVFPSGDRPARRTSNLNLVRGQTVANAVTAVVGRSGSVVLSVSRGRAHVVLDVVGWWAPGDGARFVPSAPARVLDTRQDGGRVAAGADRRLVLDDAPAEASAAVLSVTATGATVPADLSVVPTGTEGERRTSTLNLRPGEAVANLAHVRTGSDGAVRLSASHGALHVVVDVLGYLVP